ncbi:Uncharacterised protein [Vibrio cholerae]|nr:Uncharacterised protein [Vibrio cholerae]
MSFHTHKAPYRAKATYEDQEHEGKTPPSVPSWQRSTSAYKARLTSLFAQGCEPYGNRA